MPAPYCQPEGSSVVWCLGSCDTAADGTVPAPHCPSSSILQRKPCQSLVSSARGRGSTRLSSPPPPLPWSGMRCLARLSAGLSAMVQALHPLPTVGAQAQPCVPAKPLPHSNHLPLQPLVCCTLPWPPTHSHTNQGDGEGWTFEVCRGRLWNGAAQHSLLVPVTWHWHIPAENLLSAFARDSVFS